jgi:hypothetical protein
VNQKPNCNLNLRVLAGCALAVFAAACGASTAQQVPIHKAGPAGLGLAQTSHSVTMTPYDMAYGRPGALASARAPRLATRVDDYLLLPEAKTARHPARPIAPARESAKVALAVLAPAKQSVSPAASSESAQGEAAEVQLAAAEPPKSSSGLERYSQRAQNSRDLLQFRGGDAIVITASTLVIVLLIVLLLILLT